MQHARTERLPGSGNIGKEHPCDRQSTSMATVRLPEASYNNTTFVQDKEDGLRIPADTQVKW